MNILVTGSSQGIGLSIANKFLANGHTVYGMDVKPSHINNSNYIHIIHDVTDTNYPLIDNNINILINNAGVQNSENDIKTNLEALINVTEFYAYNPEIKSVLNIGSASGHTGSEFAYYSASKGGVISYTKYLAMDLSKYKATVNSLDPGPIITPINDCIIKNHKLYNAVANMNLLNRWATADEMADWAYFLTVENKFATAQNFLVDGGEANNYKFIWEE